MKNICIVSPETIDTVSYYGMGKHAYRLLNILKETNNHITLIELLKENSGLDKEYYEQRKKKWQEKGVEYYNLVFWEEEPCSLDNEWFTVNSYKIYKFILSCNNFTDIFFYDLYALAFHTIQAKRTTNDFEKLNIYLNILQPRLWGDDEINHWRIKPLVDAKLEWCERYCARFADTIIFMNIDDLNWVKRENWIISQNREIIDVYDNELDFKFFNLLEKNEINNCLNEQKEKISVKSNSSLVSLCIAYYNYGKFLPKLLNSIENTDYDRLEVIVVNDGSSEEYSNIVFKELKEKYIHDNKKIKWIFKEKENEGIGKTRNFAANEANGEYLIFLDADNVILPNLVKDLVLAIKKSDTDCVACHYDKFVGEGDPPIGEEMQSRFMPIGGCLECGVLDNVFGDATVIVKKEVFFAIGGFGEERYTSGEDREFLAKLNLQGYQQEVLPKPLFWYRLTFGGFSRVTDEVDNCQRVLKPFYASLPSYMKYFLYSTLVANLDYRVKGEQIHFDDWLKICKKNVFNRKIAIFGAGSSGVDILKALEISGCMVSCFIDNNVTKVNTLLQGVPILSLAEVSKEKFFIIVASVWHTEISKQLLDTGFIKNKDYIVAPW